MTINDIQEEIIEEFSALDDWMDKYQLLIDLGGEQEPLDEKYKTEQNIIEGCQSRVWIQCDASDGEDGKIFATNLGAVGNGYALACRETGSRSSPCSKRLAWYKERALKPVSQSGT